MNTKGYCTEALGYKCVHVRDIDWIFLSNHLVQLAKPSPVRPPGLGGGKAVCPLLSPLQLRHLLLAAAAAPGPKLSSLPKSEYA